MRNTLPKLLQPVLDRIGPVRALRRKVSSCGRGVVSQGGGRPGVGGLRGAARSMLRGRRDQLHATMSPLWRLRKWSGFTMRVKEVRVKEVLRTPGTRGSAGGGCTTADALVQIGGSYVLRRAAVAHCVEDGDGLSPTQCAAAARRKASLEVVRCRARDRRRVLGGAAAGCDGLPPGPVSNASPGAIATESADAPAASCEEAQRGQASAEGTRCVQTSGPRWASGRLHGVVEQRVIVRIDRHHRRAPKPHAHRYFRELPADTAGIQETHGGISAMHATYDDEASPSAARGGGVVLASRRKLQSQGDAYQRAGAAAARARTQCLVGRVVPLLTVVHVDPVVAAEGAHHPRSREPGFRIPHGSGRHR